MAAGAGLCCLQPPLPGAWACAAEAWQPPEEPAGGREEGTVLSCTDQEAPAVADLPAPIHVGQHEGEGLPEEERRDSHLPTRPVMANL